MQALPIKPQRREISAKVLCIVLCVIAMIVLPEFCLPIALILPLFACPLYGTRHQMVAILSVAAPPMISLASGIDTLYSVSLLALCGLPMLVTSLLQSDKRAARPIAFLYYIGAYAVGLLLVISCASRALGGNISTGLSALLTNRVATSPDSASQLFQMVSLGLVNIPKGYEKVTMLTFLFDAAFVRQCLMSLQLTLELMITNLLPSLYVQACLICGLFTALRVQKMHYSFILVGKDPSHQKEEKQVHISMSPGFSALRLSKNLNWAVLAMGLASLLMMGGASGTLVMQLSLLCGAIFTSVYQLLGAAVLVGIFSSRHSDRKGLYGILVTALYVIFPMILYLIGLFDPIFGFRAKAFSRKEEE